VDDEFSPLLSSPLLSSPQGYLLVHKLPSSVHAWMGPWAYGLCHDAAKVALHMTSWLQVLSMYNVQVCVLPEGSQLFSLSLRGRSLSKHKRSSTVLAEKQAKRQGPAAATILQSHSLSRSLTHSLTQSSSSSHDSSLTSSCVNVN
jgi:hypothetical protein